LKRNKLYLGVIFALTIAGVLVFGQREKNADDLFISYLIDTKKQDIKLYWKDDREIPFKNIGNLKTWLERKQLKLVFAMNGGMYKQDNSPQGLYIEDQKIFMPLDTSSGNGNFYLKPNGVFYITTNNVPVVCSTTNFSNNGQIKYATQSGPMLVIEGRIHPAFKKGSANVNIRNGVGILPGNKIIFAMSKRETNFYDFAHYFKSLGCKNALYLDGLVSRTYLPEKKWMQTDGNFGVIIAVTQHSN
jgi:uncharacterized protein YigE (DUF2233 family)